MLALELIDPPELANIPYDVNSCNNTEIAVGGLRISCMEIPAPVGENASDEVPLLGSTFEGDLLSLLRAEFNIVVAIATLDSCRYANSCKHRFSTPRMQSLRRFRLFCKQETYKLVKILVVCSLLPPKCDDAERVAVASGKSRDDDVDVGSKYAVCNNRTIV